MAGGRPRKFSNPAELQKKINSYFEDCRREEEPPRITALCEYLDIHRDTLCEYEKKEEFSDTIKRAKQKVEDSFVRHALIESKPTGAIFLLKACFGYKDNLQLEHAATPETKFEVSFIKSDKRVDAN
jgi:hypothetical protein